MNSVIQSCKVVYLGIDLIGIVLPLMAFLFQAVGQCGLGA